MRPAKLAVFFVSFPAILVATTIHVPDDHSTIQAGIDAAITGDTILVAPGTYIEGCYEVDHYLHEVGLILKSGITLRSQAGPAVTTIKKGECASVLFCMDLESRTVVEGFTIRDANWGLRGTALYSLNSHLSVRDCYFVHCGAFGAPISVHSSDVEFVSCTVDSFGRGGYVTDGGSIGVFDGSMLLASECEFSNNMSHYKGGVFCINSSTVEIEWSQFYNNGVGLAGGEGGHGGAIASRLSFLSVSNCTFHSNSSSGRGSGIYSESDMFLGVHNTIITGGVGGAALDVEDDPIGWWIHCTDSYGNEGGDWEGFFEPLLGVEGNISQDPMYCDPEASNFHLHTASPCAAENNPDCGQVGVFGIACGETGVESTTWSDLKILY